jgi:hypothetical protein
MNKMRVSNSLRRWGTLPGWVYQVVKEGSRAVLPTGGY